MGTYAIVDLPEDKVYEAYRYLRDIEEKLSDYIENSEVSRINRMAGKEPVDVSEETYRAIEEAIYVSKLTDGAFDITVGSYTINYKRLGLLSKDKALSLIDYKKIKLEKGKVFLEKEGMAIDLGGIGKGYAVESAYQKLNTPWGFISIAGDMKIWGHRRRIAVYDPMTGGVLLEGINRKDVCLSTSGNYFRKHIIGKPNNITQVTVAYKDCGITDGLSTGLYAMEDSKLEEFMTKYPEFGVLILYKNGRVVCNRSFLEYVDIIYIHAGSSCKAEQH